MGESEREREQMTCYADLEVALKLGSIQSWGASDVTHQASTHRFRSIDVAASLCLRRNWVALLSLPTLSLRRLQFTAESYLGGQL